MKKLIFLCILCCSTMLIQAQLTRVQKNSKYGYADANGKVVIACQYDDAAEFSEGMAAVNKGATSEDVMGVNFPMLFGGKWGFNDKGELVIALQYDQAGDFSKGKAEVKLGNDTFIIDTKGSVIK